MAVFKIFPSKDAFLNSQFPTANTGKDEILEIANYKDSSKNQQLSRAVVEFSTEELQRVAFVVAEGAFIEASLDLYLANASEIPTELTLQSALLTKSWENGTGKFDDSPANRTGVSWLFSKGNEQDQWDSAGGDFDTGSIVSQSFLLNSSLDVKLDVSEQIKSIISGSINNNGFIVKLSDQDEQRSDVNLTLRYFSVDTNSIFPPQLSIKWDDSVYNTGSLEVLDDIAPTITLRNNKSIYFTNEIVRFRLSPRPTFPIRRFTTASIFNDIFALPEGSTWALKDEGSEELVIDFDSNYTKISCDDKGPYIDIFMAGLQPERYYRLLFKTVQDSSLKVVDNTNLFKIKRYV